MPILDMPLSRLKEYRGITPRPADFDEFWDNELAKIHAYDGKYTVSEYKTVHASGLKIESLDYVMPDGSVINARVTRPDDAKKHAVLFRFHGKGGDIGAANGDFQFLFADMIVVSLNCRSQSGPSDDKGERGLLQQSGLVTRGLNLGRDHLYYKDVFLDVVRLVDIIKEQPYCDKSKLYAHGGSQGGGLTIACAALCPEIKACAAVFPFLCDYKRLYEMDLMKYAYEELREYLRNFCPCEGEERDKMWETLGYIDLKNFAPRVKADVMWFTGLLDDVCPPSTQFSAYNSLTCKKEMVIYTNHGHEGNWRTDEKVFEFFARQSSLAK